MLDISVCHFFFFKQLVYKVKASTFLERLASASIGSCGQTVWLDLVSEAKENLQKIQVHDVFVEHFMLSLCLLSLYSLSLSCKGA